MSVLSPCYTPFHVKLDTYYESWKTKGSYTVANNFYPRSPPEPTINLSSQLYLNCMSLNIFLTALRCYFSVQWLCCNMKGRIACVYRIWYREKGEGKRLEIYNTREWRLLRGLLPPFATTGYAHTLHLLEPSALLQSCYCCTRRLEIKA